MTCFNSVLYYSINFETKFLYMVQEILYIFISIYVHIRRILSSYLKNIRVVLAVITAKNIKYRMNEKKVQ